MDVCQNPGCKPRTGGPYQTSKRGNLQRHSDANHRLQTPKSASSEIKKCPIEGCNGGKDNGPYQSSKQENIERHKMTPHLKAPKLKGSKKKGEMLKGVNEKGGMKQAKIFKCEQCVYKTTRKDNLQRHKDEKHKNLKTFKCKQCDFMAARAHDMNRHNKAKHGETVHGGSENEGSKCELCEYITKENSNMKRHMMSVHRKQKDKNVSLIKKLSLNFL